MEWQANSALACQRERDAERRQNFERNEIFAVQKDFAPARPILESPNQSSEYKGPVVSLAQGARKVIG